jgi:hypothetical protein
VLTVWFPILTLSGSFLLVSIWFATATEALVISLGLKLVESAAETVFTLKNKKIPKNSNIKYKGLC